MYGKEPKCVFEMIDEEIDAVKPDIDDALRLAEKLGVSEAEVYVVMSKETSVGFEQNVIESTKESFLGGFGVRAVIDGAVGCAGTNIPGRLSETMKSAVAVAKVMEKDPEWKSLPSGRTERTSRKLFSDELADLSLEECIDMSLRLIDGIGSVGDCRPISGGLSRSVSGKIVMNTNGVCAKQTKTILSAYADVSAGQDENMAQASEFDLSHDMTADPYLIGKKAAELARRSVGAGASPSGKMPVIFGPTAFSDILEYAFLDAVDAEAVQKGRSALAGKTGEEIAGEAFSLTDDGTVDGGLAGGTYDDEGTPTQRTKIIENGILQSFLYDARTAGKENRQSTGNGFRGSYASSPGVSPTNLIVSLPKTDIIGETKRGIYVTGVIGAHTANAISGDFSVECRNAFLIENGEMTRPLRSVMISGNAFDILKKADGAGSDVRHTGTVVTPSVRISEMSVIGTEDA